MVHSTDGTAYQRPYAVRLAVEHVHDRSTGRPLERDLRVTLNFHPDRHLDTVPILAAMACDGVYQSQFETGTSNGGLTAHPGLVDEGPGDR